MDSRSVSKPKARRTRPQSTRRSSKTPGATPMSRLNLCVSRPVRPTAKQIKRRRTDADADRSTLSNPFCFCCDNSGYSNRSCGYASESARRPTAPSKRSANCSPSRANVFAKSRRRCCANCARLGARAASRASWNASSLGTRGNYSPPKRGRIVSKYPPEKSVKGHGAQQRQFVQHLPRAHRDRRQRIVRQRAESELLRCPELEENARTCALFSSFPQITRKSKTVWRSKVNSNCRFRF